MLERRQRRRPTLAQHPVNVLCLLGLSYRQGGGVCVAALEDTAEHLNTYVVDTTKYLYILMSS